MKEKILTSMLKKIDPEVAHKVAIFALKYDFLPKVHISSSKLLETDISGIKLNHPIGMSAGFDKNAEALKGLMNIGFSFVEIGAVTPKAQKGNSKPRIHRLLKEKGIINSLGFNNLGMNAVYNNLVKKPRGLTVGINLGSNKETLDRSLDFIKVLKLFNKTVDFATLNISSPNTKNLRNLQNKEELESLLTKLTNERKKLLNEKPLFLKISPDLTDDQIENIVNLTLKFNLSGIIATNTSIGRENLDERWKKTAGGLSGKPIFQKSTTTLAKIAILSKSKFPIIGVGGIFSAEDAFEKICAGASALQIYSAFTFVGPLIVKEICKNLEQILVSYGFKNISEAVGTKKNNWVS